jgi:hypothetical protein
MALKASKILSVFLRYFKKYRRLKTASLHKTDKKYSNVYL